MNTDMISQPEQLPAAAQPICVHPCPSVVALSFTVAEHAEFFAKRVPNTEQNRVRVLLAAFNDIFHSANQNATLKALSVSLQMPFNTLRRLYYGYKSGCVKKIAGAETRFAAGDWRSVLNWSKVQPERQNLPYAFLEFWRALGERNQRKWKPAWDELIQIIKTGHDFKGRRHTKIPGYDQWPQIDPVLRHPPGMSYQNLIRHTSSRYDQAAVRIGRSAATRFRIPVLKSREDLRIGQFMEFDDHEFNQKVLFQKKPMRPLCFAAVDVLTDCLFRIGVKPTFWDEETEMKRKLTEREFLWFLLAVLCGTGYRRDAVGTTLVMERGTTTVREPYLSRLKAVLGEGVKFYFGSNAGRNTRAAHAGQFGGQPKGNFRTKAIVESKWNTIDNQTASLLGQVGKDRDHAPAQLYGAERYTGQMMRAAEEKNLSPDLLRLPFEQYHQWCQFCHQAVERINTARDHQCQGWEKLGFVKKLWRSDAGSPLWHSENDFQLLSDIDRAVINAKLIADKSGALTKVERAHRWEVFQALRRELKPLPWFHVPEILGPDFALDGGALIAVGRQLPGLISFQCEEIDSDPIHFYARDVAAEAGHFIPNGRKFVCFVNPYLPTHLVACDEQLRVQAVCPRYEPARDAAGLEKNMGAQNAMEAAQRVRLNLRHDSEGNDLRAMREHNERVLNAVAGGASVPASRPDADCTDELLSREGTTPAEESNW